MHGQGRRLTPDPGFPQPIEYWSKDGWLVLLSRTAYVCPHGQVETRPGRTRKPPEKLDQWQCWYYISHLLVIRSNRVTSFNFHCVGLDLLAASMGEGTVQVAVLRTCSRTCSIRCAAFPLQRTLSRLAGSRTQAYAG